MPKAEPEYTTLKQRHRQRPPSPGVRTMDLYGRPGIWSRAAQVVPVDAFERHGRWIKSGHYVIDHNGKAIAVHCGNHADGTVSLLFVRGDARSRSVPRAEIEPLLLGRVVVEQSEGGQFAQEIRELSQRCFRLGEEGEEA